jgi:hypothetical protein
MNTQLTEWIIRIQANQYLSFKGQQDLQFWHPLFPLYQSGARLKEKWRITYRAAYKEHPADPDLPPSDFTRGIVAEALNQRARSILMPLIGDQVEFLPFSTPFGFYYDLNSTYLDCLDETRSIVKRLDSGRIMRIVKYSFHWEKMDGVHIFRITDLVGTLFVSDTFKKLVETNHLTGLYFDPVLLA